MSASQKLLSPGSSRTTSSGTDRHRPSGRRPPEPAEPGPLRSVDGGEKGQMGRPLFPPLPSGRLARHGDRGVSGGIDPGRQGQALAGPGSWADGSSAACGTLQPASCGPRAEGERPRRPAPQGHRPFHTVREASSALAASWQAWQPCSTRRATGSPRPAQGRSLTAIPTHTTCVPSSTDRRHCRW